MKPHYTLCAALLGLTAATQAGAAVHVFCVSDDAELRTAIFQAPGIALQDPAGVVDIRLQRRPGTPYALDSLPDTQNGLPFGNLKLRGGYSNTPGDQCSEAGRIVHAQDTALTYQPAGGDWLKLHTLGDLFVEGIAFDLDYGIWATHGKEYSKISFVANRLSAALGDYALLIEKRGSGSENAYYRVVNNLISGVGDGGGCAVRIRNIVADQQGNPAGETDAVLVNNTIVDNAGTALCYRHLASIKLHNNIVWGNGAAIEDAGNDASPITLRYNLLQAGSVLPGLVGTHEGALSVDPGFAAGYRPGPGSPAVNSGNPNAVPGGLPAQDLDGHPRKIAIVDRGAFESADTGTGEIVVNTADDSVDGNAAKTSLREAITLANDTPGPNRITFGIGSPPSCPATLLLATPLPAIEETLEIDGFTQGSARPNAQEYGFDGELCVALLSTGLTTGLQTAPLEGVALTVRGLHLAGFETAIDLRGGRGHLIEGNIFGSQLLSNEINLAIADGVSEVLVGGYEPDAKNLIAAALDTGVMIAPGASANAVVGNTIGPRIDGVEDPGMRNYRGMLLAGSDNQVSGNEILYSEDYGISVSGSGNTVSANRIVANATGIRVGSLAGVGDASDNSFLGNELAYNTEAAIGVSHYAQRNRIVAGSFYENDGQAIDLEYDGQIQHNDADIGAASQEGNRGQNYPRLLAADVIGDDDATAQVLGVLDSRNGSYTLRFYASSECDATGYGEGETFVGTTQVSIENATALANGSAGFSVPVSALDSLAGRYITATATDQDGNTSEFSACRFVGPDSIFADGFED